MVQEILKFLLANDWAALLAAIVLAIGAAATFFHALAIVFLCIPGNEPEATFEKISVFLAKFSKK